MTWISEKFIMPHKKALAMIRPANILYSVSDKAVWQNLQQIKENEACSKRTGDNTRAKRAYMIVNSQTNPSYEIYDEENTVSEHPQGKHRIVSTIH